MPKDKKIRGNIRIEDKIEVERKIYKGKKLVARGKAKRIVTSRPKTWKV